MGDRRRHAAYASLWVLALAFGWIEASAVVYLREIYMREALLPPTTFKGLQQEASAETTSRDVAGGGRERVAEEDHDEAT